MLVISDANLTGLIGEIAQRARSITDHNGDAVILPTMTDQQLRTAAITAIAIAAGRTVWPADEPIDLRAKERQNGPLSIQR